MNDTPQLRSIVPAFFVVYAGLDQADDVAATAAEFLNDCTTERSAGADLKLYLCTGSPTTALDPAAEVPHTLEGLTCDASSDDALIDVILKMRADIGPLVGVAQRFVDAFGPAFANDGEINGGDVVDVLGSLLPLLETALKPFTVAESAVLAEPGTQGPAESAQDTLKVADAVETELVRGGVPRITLQLPVSDQLCASILCSALEGGTNYWAAVSDIKQTEAKDEFGINDYISAKFHDTECEEGDEPAFEPQVVDYTTIRTGIQRILAGEVKVRRDLSGAIQSGVVENDGGHIDADAADVIVQAGMFGDITFG